MRSVKLFCGLSVAMHIPLRVRGVGARGACHQDAFAVVLATCASTPLSTAFQLLPPSCVTRIVPLPPHEIPKPLLFEKLTSRNHVKTCERTSGSGLQVAPSKRARVPSTPVAAAAWCSPAGATERRVLNPPLDTFVQVAPPSVVVNRIPLSPV